MATKRQQAEALERLRETVHEGDVITCVLRGRTRTGTSYADFYILSRPPAGPHGHMDPITRVAPMRSSERIWLSRRIADAMGLRWNAKRDCIALPFMNMDQAFATVNALSHRLFGRGDALTREWL